MVPLRALLLLPSLVLPTAALAGETIFSEFDGVSTNGVWERLEPLHTGFDFAVTPAQFEMSDGLGSFNQHVVRQGIWIDPARPYAIECDFTIAEFVGLTSFALHLNVAPDDFGPSDKIDTWSINMDLLGEVPQFDPIMRWMGFVDGIFSQIPTPQSLSPWAQAGAEFHVLIKVNENLAGEYVPQMVSVVWTKAGQVRGTFERDYSTHAYQPDYSGTVRVGLNSHDANWTLRNLHVYYLDEVHPVPVLGGAAARTAGVLAMLLVVWVAARYLSPRGGKPDGGQSVATL